MSELFTSEFWLDYGPLLGKASIDTLVMVLSSTLIAYVVGILLAVVLKLTEPNGLKPQPVFNAVLGWVVNMGRSLPFIILLIILIPFTRTIVGTIVGIRGAVVPLAVCAIPFVARMVESSFSDVHPGRIEAAQAFGASTTQIVTKVFLRESLPSLIRGAAITCITLVGYVAMAGAVGAGGLGDVAIRYGYYRYQSDVMIASVLILIIVVQIIQSVFNLIARRIDKR
ncbi:MAG: ABC transporter permease [Coriobacteriales bacterium]|jgi:D-methionine transport system permease protein|nr:ABC transporter permease [Coriobacteriales bacterium]